MLENQTKKILLLSDDPADASFLSELAITQQADLEVVPNTSDLCEKIAKYRADQSLAAIFIDVTTPPLLRKFEYELQTKMGTMLASELSLMTHYISGTPLALNREVRQSPYFSFYSGRKTFDFSNSANFYQPAFGRASDLIDETRLGFDLRTRNQCYEKIKKEFLSQEMSVEWLLKFKTIFEELLERFFPARFDCSIEFVNHTFQVVLSSASTLDQEQFRVEDFLELGVSVTLSKNVLAFFIPVFPDLSAAVFAFSFYKVEHE